LSQRPFTVVLIVPTGIGASIGGYAGDAMPVARAIANVCDCLITHPNVLNGAQLYWPLPDALYVEGYGLDQFAAGQWGLAPVHQNAIGLVLDQEIEPELQLRHLQAAAAARATLGLSLTDFIVTDAPLEVTLQTSASGATWGTIGNPDSLLRAAERLIREAGATAIAVVARFPDHLDSIALQNYRHGCGVDPLAGAEAVISHLVVREFQIPCAHAPALAPLPLDPNLSPRSAAEELGYTFLPCVLAGLSRAPQFVNRPLARISKSPLNPRHFPQVGEPAPRSDFPILGDFESISNSCSPQNWGARGARDDSRKRSNVQDAVNPAPNLIHRDQVDAVVVPESACGGSGVLHLSQTSATIITVRGNQTTMQVTPSSVGLSTISVHSYLEAVGVLVALRAGLDPKILDGKVDGLRSLN
jgi:hypothetical protein